MIRDIIQLFKIGKELGLSKKEINKVLIFDNSKHTLLFISLLVLSFIFFGIIIIILLEIEASRNTYGAGSYYSTVMEKDFKGKNIKIKLTSKFE